jgi:hypothetical protein
LTVKESRGHFGIIFGPLALALCYRNDAPFQLVDALDAWHCSAVGVVRFDVVKHKHG